MHACVHVHSPCAVVLASEPALLLSDRSDTLPYHTCIRADVQTCRRADVHGRWSIWYMHMAHAWMHVRHTHAYTSRLCCWPMAPALSRMLASPLKLRTTGGHHMGHGQGTCMHACGQNLPSPFESRTTGLECIWALRACACMHAGGTLWALTRTRASSSGCSSCITRRELAM